MLKEEFRFGVMGAGNIAHKFCDAVRLAGSAKVSAVASKNMERAQCFALEEGIEKAFDSYAQMLEEDKPDCVYIAATSDAHYELTMLCLDAGVPVLCEKAMFMNSRQAMAALSRAKELGIFVMEAMWSRFLPAVNQARTWITDGLIGDVILADAAIGFRAPQDDTNRYFSPALGGGAAFDLTVYAYELITWLVPETLKEYEVQAVRGKTGVDVTEQILLRFETAMAVLRTTLMTKLDEHITIYGTLGKIVIPRPHFASECFLYTEDENEVEQTKHYEDQATENGFVYEVREVMECIRAGRLESAVVPHKLTQSCAELFDVIERVKR